MAPRTIRTKKQKELGIIGKQNRSKKETPMLESIQSGDEFYFVHSYYARPVDSNNVVGTTDYGDKTFCSVVARENLFATQFHLEKSGELGLKLLGAFKHWDATC